MRSRKTRVLAIFLVLSLLGAACSKSSDTKEKKKTEDSNYEKHSMETKDPDATEETTETTEPSQRDTSVRPVSTPTPTPEVIPMLTASDIQNMNNNNALIVYNDEGNVSTIVGRFFHRPVADEDDAINAVKGVQELLGLQTGYFPFAVYGARYQGYTYYTYEQVYDNVTVQNATLKVVLDPEGYPCMLQSSLVSNLGYTIDTPTIDEAEAERIVLNRMGGGYTVFSGCTMKTSLVDFYIATHCYQVFTNNPAGDISFDMPYIVHFVGFDGEYIKSYPTGSLPQGNMSEVDTESYFKDLVATDATFVAQRNGEDYEITVPISYNTVDGKYYMADPSRKIMVADYYEFIYNDGNLAFECKDSGDTWSANHLATYYNYIRVYDFFKTFHIESTDGFGMPILILTGYCDKNKNPVNNACNMGVLDGWSVLASSEANDYGYCMDVCGHEYTHGITHYNRQGSIYANEYGAINEAFSDMLGNIAEIYCGDTTDTTWLVGENSGRADRCMSDPMSMGQPVEVGGLYYYCTSPHGEYTGFNDKGGVHLNNSLISHLAYVLYESGMSLDDLTYFLLCAIDMHTPKADYDDMYAVFIAAASVSGHAEIIPIIDQYWEDAKLGGSREQTVENSSVPGYTRVNIPFDISNPDVASIALCCNVKLIDSDGYYTTHVVQWDGVASILVPADGTPYLLLVVVYDDMVFTNELGCFGLKQDGSAWTTNMYDMGLMTAQSGLVITTPVIS